MTRVAAIILAAGASTRLGQPKQLVRLGGETLLARTVRAAAEAGCKPVVVVLGAHAKLLQEQCSLVPAHVVVNPAWEEGMASSIRTGVASVLHDVDAAVLMACDQPAVDSVHIRRLLTRDPNRITASAYAGGHGVPAYFPARYFPHLVRLTGDQGARELVTSADSIELPSGELDIDTPERLAAARSAFEQKG